MPEYGPVVIDPALIQQLGGATQYGPPVDPITAKFLDQVPASGQAPVKTGIPSLMTDFFHGVRQPVDQGAAMLARALFPSQVPAVAAANQAGEQAYQQEGDAFGPLSTGARLAGNAAATAPLAYAMPGAGAAGLGTRMLSGAASGAASGALQPADVNAPDFWDQTGQNALFGGAAGAVAPAVLSGLARLINPAAVARNAPLMERGVTPTPGQILGGPIGRAEEAIGSVPGIGDVTRTGRLRAVNQFNEGAINDVLAPIGQRIEGGATGREAIMQMGDRVRDAYNSAVPAAGGVMDHQALSDMTSLRSMAQFMPPATGRQFDSIMRGLVLDKIAPNGGMTGQSFKEAESDLGRIVRGHLYNPGATSAERQLGGAVRELQSTLRQWLARVSPNEAPQIAAANDAYARMLRVENAATRGNSMEPGQFTPSQLLAGVKKYATQRQFAQGRGLMQDYAEAGKNVLGDKVPDSGTPFRYFLGTLGAGTLGHSLPEPFATSLLGLAAGTAGAAGLYSPLGQRAIAHLLAARPQIAEPIAQGVRGLGPVGSVALPSILGAFAP